VNWQGFAYSDGSAKFRAVNTLVIEELPSSPATTEARLAAPAVFDDALDQWRAILDATTPAGLYAITYSATTQRVTIASTNGVQFRPVWAAADRPLALWLGFDPDAAYAFGLSHVGTLVPYGRAELLGVEVEPPEDASKADVQQVRLGRAIVAVFGNHLLQAVDLIVKGDRRPASWAWLTAGKLRIYVSADVNPYSAANPDGYLEGYVVTAPQFDKLGADEGIDVVSLVLAVAR
jgi:hypothetical protein